jgi:hypothetical protein
MERLRGDTFVSQKGTEMRIRTVLPLCALATVVAMVGGGVAPVIGQAQRPVAGMLGDPDDGGQIGARLVAFGDPDDGGQIRSTLM